MVWLVWKMIVATRSLCLLAIVVFDLVKSIVTPQDVYSVKMYLEMAERQQDFVLDAFQIGYAGLNPSMLRDPTESDKIVMVWRKGKERNSKIGFMRMDSKWNPIQDFSTVSTLDSNHTQHGGKSELTGEDPRIFSLNGELMLTYNVHHGKYKTVHYAKSYRHKRPPHLSKTSDGPSLWSAVSNNEELVYVLSDLQHNVHCAWDEGRTERHEKNWSPFEFCPLCVFRYGSVQPGLSGHYRAHLLFSYSLQPHIVVQTHTNEPHFAPADDVVHPLHRWQTRSNTVAEKVYETKIRPEDEWQWGEMRGGSPALLVGDSYLAFFHSSGRLTHRDVITYVMGAYLFQREPPFAITHISPEPIVHPSMVNETLGWAYKVVDYIIFPMGLVYDDRYIYVSYGKNDKTPWCLKLEKEGLLASLKAVKTTVVGGSDFDTMTGQIVRHSYRERSIEK